MQTSTTHLWHATAGKNHKFFLLGKKTFKNSDAAMDISSLLKAHFFQYRIIKQQNTREEWILAPVLSQRYSEGFYHKLLFVLEARSPVRIRRPDSRTGSKPSVRTFCRYTNSKVYRTEEIADGDEPFQYPWPPVARRGMKNSWGKPACPRRCGIPISG